MLELMMNSPHAFNTAQAGATGLMGSVAIAAFQLPGWMMDVWYYLLVFIGFSVVIFFHELGHFLAAKWCDVKVDRFAIGFGRTLLAYRKGVGLSVGTTADKYWAIIEQYVNQRRTHDLQLKEKLAPTESEIHQAHRDLGIGETEYCFNLLPLGGYVKMLGQEDFDIDKSGEIKVKQDPRAFTYKPIRQRMFIVSAGVIANLIFAAMVFMLVFMIGVTVPPAIVGMVDPDSPAQQAGLQVGDRIVEINGDEVREFNDIRPAVMLANPKTPLNLKFERPDPQGGPSTTHNVTVIPEMNEAQNRPQVGIAPMMNNSVLYVLDDPAIPTEEEIHAGDRILEVDGHPVSDLWQITQSLKQKSGAWAKLKVERSQKDAPARILETKRRAHFMLRPSISDPEVGHLLGFVPRAKAWIINPGEPAERAGIQPGDILLEWDGQANPTYKKYRASLNQNKGTPISAVVLRWDGKDYQRIQLTIQPQTPGMFGSGPARVGMDPVGQDEDHLVVADIVPKVNDEIATPAAAIRDVMPLGSLITRVNDQPVQTWGDLLKQFIHLAGGDVKLTWVYDNGPEQSGTIHVPQTVGTTFDLPPHHVITRINGQKSFEVEVKGKKKLYPVDHWLAVMSALKRNVGKTIEIDHRAILDRQVFSEKLTVTPEMVDPWTLRAIYETDILATEFVTARMQEKNPFKAMLIGVDKTWYFIQQVYVMMQRMLVTKSISMDNVSGPVGIVKMGSEIAERDFIMLLYFLALISANLAVINFIPFPIVDGGLFVMLIMEKIKGGPLSLRFHMVTQLIGLAVIISIFVYVTFQDIRKIFGA